jgi:heme/copper-type cytochrome/quinol oxidase subunit 2
MKKITVLIISIVAILGFALVPLAAPTYATRDCSTLGASEQAGCAACIVEDDANDWDGGECNRGDKSNLTDIIHTVINVMLFIIGILSVIMIIFGGIRYTTSTGDKTRVDAAKNTIIYSVVGLVVAIVAFALVQWVFGALAG